MVYGLKGFISRVCTMALGLLLLGGVALASPVNFNYSGTIVTYTVTDNGVYQITAWGAQGGNTSGGTGGKGTEAGGEFFLQAGDVLQILTAGQGGSRFAGGGGGGSFISLGSTLSSSTLLVAAGGGGGAGPCCYGGNAQSGTNGVNPGGVAPGAGGTNGGGGGAGQFVNGGFETAGGG